MQSSPVIDISPADLEQLKADLAEAEARRAATHAAEYSYNPEADGISADAVRGPGHLCFIPAGECPEGLWGRHPAGLWYIADDGKRYGANDLELLPSMLHDFVALWKKLDMVRVQEQLRLQGLSEELPLDQVLEQPELRPATTAGWARRAEIRTEMWHRTQLEFAKRKLTGPYTFDAVKAEVEKLRQAGLIALKEVITANQEPCLLKVTPVVLHDRHTWQEESHYLLGFKLTDTVIVTVSMPAPAWDRGTAWSWHAAERQAVHNYLELLQCVARRPEIQAEPLWEEVRAAGQVDWLQPIDWEKAAEWMSRKTAAPDWLAPTLPEYEFGGLDRFTHQGAI